ncbi:hypothetical protein [Cellulomonas wangsupingiae]|uniref:DUF3806 domain-containing protein n=1 Tax=Cellulomonas wangsupingiae TaxID=2968085 RepID=A0ABY5K5I8_9CELL|nr:hypothetical protein [Cellulomonas wangsupingiae]MCC2336302.1 hypothetical protein [Cellulomonas wangsupingiae]UUI65719.1 hypothetical protein NP075_02995 [Cellulomonas wangsupingiae]
MDTVSPAIAARSAAPTGPVLARSLTPGEAAHLDRLRDWLRHDGTDAQDVDALDARWERLLLTHPADAPAPAGVAAAIGIAVGDVLVASVTGAVWMMCPGPEGATPGVLLPARPHMPVLPVLDAHARWRVRSPRWTVDYAERAAAHLRAGRLEVPTPHPAPGTPEVDTAAATPGIGSLPAVTDASSTESAAWEAAFADEAQPSAPPPSAPQDAAPWVPVFVDDTHGRLPARTTTPPAGTPHVPAPPEPEVWTPTFVDRRTEAPDDQAPPPVVAPLDPVAPPAPVAPPVVPPLAADEASSAVTPGRGIAVHTDRPLTPEDLPHRPSERVQDLALRALELALDRAVRDATGCAPFVLVREGDDIEVLDFAPSASGLAEAREAARSGGYTAAAVAWTSHADATRPFPRVVVDASAPGRPGIRVAHSFAHDEDGGREVGGPQVVGQSAPVL